jgi:hypothetical protein
MTNQKPQPETDAGLQRPPDEWKTGDEPMTAAQRSYLETLAREAGETFDESLSAGPLIGLQCDVASSTLFDAGDGLAGCAYGGWRAQFDEGRCMAPHDRTGR